MLLAPRITKENKMSKQKIRTTAMLQFSAYGDDIQSALWVMRFGDKKRQDIAQEDFDKFMDFFANKYIPAESEDDENKFTTEIENLNELQRYLNAFIKKHVEVRLNISIGEKGKEYLFFHWCILNTHPSNYVPWNNMVNVSLDTAAISEVLQQRIDKAIEALNGK